MRPHERRALQGHSADPDPSEPIIAMPVVGLLEMLEEQFPNTCPDLKLPPEVRHAEVTFGRVQRRLGQLEVIQFIRNLEAQRTGAQ